MSAAINGQEILDVIHLIETANGMEEVLAVYTPFVECFGFSGLMIGHLVDPAKTGHGTSLGFSNWPTELMQKRRDSMAFVHDPIIKYALRTQRPFFWSEAFSYANRIATSVIQDIQDFDLRDGLMLPMIEIDSLPGGISLATQTIAITSKEIPSIQLVSQHCFYKLQRLAGPFKFEISAHLSEREVNVLDLASRGKTSWETGIVLGMPETAVKAALKRACRKLDAVNKTQAVANAMARRIIL